MLASRVRAGLLATLLAAGVLAAPSSPSSAAEAADDAGVLHLVTLNGSGTAVTRSLLPTEVVSLWMRGTQDQILASVDAGPPTYRWTAALNGFAVELDQTQAARLAADPRVALVEPNRLLTLAAVPQQGNQTSATTATLPGGSGRDGAGTVIGFVDSGLTPEGSVFADTPGLGTLPEHYSGSCRVAPDWPESVCGDKVVGAQWYVDGFGEDRIRDLSSRSARDDDGHGTAVASVAAGNTGLTAEVRGQRLGRFAGVAPGARIAVYKACWTAPDPRDDGCATADVVSAIDRATADHVDVLNLSVADDRRPDPERDTVARALRGATSADIAVIAAAGNGAGEVSYDLPWVTTVGATTGPIRGGELVLPGGPTLRGVTVANREVGPARLVRGSDVAARGRSAAQARRCEPGSLDAGKVRDRIVVCLRGGVARTAKSLAVARADGVGMVLANAGPGSLDPDVHAVPTLHIDRATARTLSQWLARNPGESVTLRSTGLERSPARQASWSRRSAQAPAVLAPGVGVLAAGRSGTNDDRWGLVSGTSIAAAGVSGAAATLRGAQDWTASQTRGALVATAPRMTAAGAGVLDLPAARSSALLLSEDDDDAATLELTNPTRRTRTYRALPSGSALTVDPPVVTLEPGASTTVIVESRGRGLISWRTPAKPPIRWRVGRVAG